MESEGASETYTRAEIRRILGINENRLRAWERVGLTELRKRYSFTDLVSLKTLRDLREQKVPAERIRESLQQIRLRLTNVSRPLGELRLVPDGRRIAVDLPGERIEALTGQMLFDFDSKAQCSVATLESGSRQPPPVAADGGESLFQYALELEREGAVADEIIAVYRKILESNSDAAGAAINVGTLYYRQGRLDLAERSYLQALSAYPDYPLAHYNLANVCEETDRLDEAAGHYEAALLAQPGYADAHYNLALVQERRQRFVEAIKHWQAYLELDPSSPWSQVARRKRDSLLDAESGPEAAVGEDAFSKPLRQADD